MLTKILFTLLVIVGVGFFFRTKNQNLQENKNDSPLEKDTGNVTNLMNPTKKSLSTRTVAYLMIAVLVSISILIFVISSNNDNRIVNIRIIGESGETTNYQARHKTIKGRNFETLDGKMVTLGESDRVEMIEQ
ncbi:MAG: hypothetical protein GKR96_02150 [Gammaproteobacteria bacterium]|nr:hypothetical protein [Gammaproteobacteria bacterium]